MIDEHQAALAELRAEMNARFDRIEVLLTELTRGLRAAGWLPPPGVEKRDDG